MRPSASFTARLMMSPHTGCSSRTSASGEASSPMLRGCSKWSRTVSEYISVAALPTACRVSFLDRFLSPEASGSARKSASPAPFCLYNPMMPENWAFPNNAPQRVVSLQPSVTVTLRDLGSLDRLVACTKYCVDVCPEALNTGCIIVEDSWSAKADQIMAARPDLVIASVPYQMESVAEILKSSVPFLGLAPRSLDDIYKDIMMIARTVSSEEPGASESRGLALITTMKKEVLSMCQKTAGAEQP